MLSSCSGKRLCGPSEKGCNKPYDRKDNAFQRDAQLFHFFFRLLTEEQASQNAYLHLLLYNYWLLHRFGVGGDVSHVVIQQIIAT